MVIGLTGKKQAGKNAVAKMLAVYSPLPVVEVSFAAPLKRSVAALLDVEVDDLEQWKNDPEAMVQVTVGGELRAWDSIRVFLQRYGTEAHRGVFGDDFWVDAGLPLGDYDRNVLYVVTDVRFPNEAQRVRDVGGVVVRVLGPPEIEKSGDRHASEAPLPESLVDKTFINIRRDDEFAQLDSEARFLLNSLELGTVAA